MTPPTSVSNIQLFAFKKRFKRNEEKMNVPYPILHFSYTMAI